MKKRDAAEYLGVSVRTLERFVSAGRLKAGRAPGKTRPVVTFQKEELEKLKAEIERHQTVQPFRRLNTESPQDSIGFRLDPQYIKELQKRGESEGLSASQVARSLVIRGLEETSASKLAEEIAALRQTIGEVFYLILTQRMGATKSEAASIVASVVKRT